MATTMGPRSGGRSRESNGRDAAARGERDQYDLLTAAALGIVAGAGIALLLRGHRKRTAGDLAREAGSMAIGAGRRGLRRAGKRGSAIVAAVPVEEIADSIGEYVQSAREAIDETVSQELNELRKAIRRQRKRMGV